MIRERGYTQPWMAETSCWPVKRAFGDALRARWGYRQFREIVSLFAIAIIGRCCEPL